MQDALFDVGQPEAAFSWVYVIGKADSSVVKIGFTDGLIPKRLISIQTSNPERLVIRWGVAGNRKLEKSLHREFKHLRMAGEWFDFGNLDPVVEIESAVEHLMAGAPMRVYGTQPQILLCPADDDPDRSNPLFQPDEFGCRRLTPMENITSNRCADAISFLCSCHSGLCPCWNS